MQKPIIAVVDQDPVYRELIGEVLREEGYAVAGWPHRSGAVGFIRTIDPVVAIVDLWLPRPDDGWTLLDELRRTPETAGLPVILTTTPPLDFRQPAVPRPLDNCELLTKPFDLDDLLAAVQRAGPLPRVREGLFCALCA